ncbi:MAG: acylphosphatase [candidate division Zixibacteria bacterium]|nr:acylphosphatase [candidate division Zixibacteria bacterium]
MNLKRVELLISGMVQGVGFRYYTYQKAQQLRVTGWVKNLPDGRVQVLAEGEREVLEEFISELKAGPNFSVIQDVNISWSESTGRFSSFEVTR